VRSRPQTIGTLGRAPARAAAPPPVAAATPPPGRGARDAVRGWLRRAIFDNVGLKFLSIVLAVTVFLLVNTDKDREITARVGVSYTLPDDRVLVSERIDEVRITIKGAWRRLRKFDEREIDRINLDLRGRVSSSEVAITNDLIHLPSGLTISSINPRSVHVAFDRRVEKVVEVTPITGRPQHGYIVKEVKPVPATVKLRGGEGVLAAVTAVRTREISLLDRTDKFTVETEVVPPEGVEVTGDAQVTVQVGVEEELVTSKLPGLTVVVRGDGDISRWQVTPEQVEVTLTGALLDVEKARSTLVPIVKLTSDLKPREVQVTIDGLPPGVGVKISPEHIKLDLLKPTKPAAPPPPPRTP
jgi:YbbR domain-containing protein